jgi:hypothetical protein
VNAALPAWADNAQGRALIEQIIAERPDHFIRSGTWIEGGGVKVYEGRTAGQLRQLFAAWWEQNYEGATDAPENGNQLIERVLREADEGQLTEVHGDPFLKARAA